MNSILTLLIVALLTGCMSNKPINTYDGKSLQCRRICPPNKTLGPSEYEQNNKSEKVWQTIILEDCCIDEQGQSWSSCAWSMHVLAKIVGSQSFNKGE